MNVALTTHAIERYRERVKPALSIKEAGADLRRMLAFAEIQPDRPAWVASQEPADSWLVIGDGIAFPLLDGPLRAVSCLTPTLDAEGAARRNERRRKRRFARMRRDEQGPKRNSLKYAGVLFDA